MPVITNRPRPVWFATKPFILLYTQEDWNAFMENGERAMEQYKADHGGQEPPLENRSDIYIEWNRHLIEGFVLGVARSRKFECPIYGVELEEKDPWGGPRHKMIALVPNPGDESSISEIEITMDGSICTLDWDDNGMPYCTKGVGCGYTCHLVGSGATSYCSCYQ